MSAVQTQLAVGRQQSYRQSAGSPDRSSAPSAQAVRRVGRARTETEDSGRRAEEFS